MLTSDRVTLRAVTPDDYPTLVRFKNDVEVELLGGGGAPRPTALAGLSEFFDGLLRDKANFSFVIEADGAVIGDTGIFNVNRVHGTAEVGIGIGERAYWNNGYGREALGLLIDFGFRLQNFRRLYLTVLANNPRAIACYRACGFVEEGRLRQHVWNGGDYVDLIYMGLFRP